MAKTISLLHPFTANSIGLREDDLIHSHSDSHVSAIQLIKGNDLQFTVDYFTGSLLPKTTRLNGIVKKFWPVNLTGFKGRHQWRKQSSSFHYIKNILSPPDLTFINMSGYGSLYTFKLSRLLVKKKKPYIAMIGGVSFETSGDAFKYYQDARQILVHTNRQQKEIKTVTGFENLDVRVLPLGVDTERFKPIRKELRVKGNLLFVGRITRLKQIELAVNSLKLIKDQGYANSSLTIIGPVSDVSYYQELLQLIHNSELTDSVKFENFIPHKELVRFYQDADLMLLPSTHESFGMVLTEAMSCGTPAASLLGSGGPEEIIIPGKNGLLSSPVNYAFDILTLLNDPEKLSKNGTAARATILEKYSIRITADILKTSINDALRSSL